MLNALEIKRPLVGSIVRGWRWFLAVGVGLFLVTWQGPYIVKSLYSPNRAPRDFFQEWASAKNVWTGLPVYAPHEQTIPLYLGRPARPGPNFVGVNAHPPVSVLLVLPLAGLDYSRAHFLWNLLSLAALAISAAIMARALGIGFSPLALLGVVVVLLSGPIEQHLFHGQLNLVLLLLIVVVWWADRSGLPGWAGTILGLAAAIKFVPAVIFLYFALQRRWSAILAGAASFLVACLTALAILGPETLRVYIEDASPQVAEWRSCYSNNSLAGFWHKLLDPGSKGDRVEPIVRAPALARWLTAGSCIGILALVAAGIRRARGNGQSDLAFALAVVACVLISPVAWDHYSVLLLLPLVLVWRNAPTFGPTWCALLVIAGILWQPHWRIYAYGEWLFGTENLRSISPIHVLTIFSLQFYALLALFGLLLWEVSKRRQSHEIDDQPEAQARVGVNPRLRFGLVSND